jgi:hypothetical protein
MSPERNDINFRAVRRGVIIGVGVLLLINVVVWGLFRFLEVRRESVDVRRSFLAPESTPPSEPLLQVVPRLDWRQFHQNQLDQLNTYGWVSRDEGRVRIPIERAMEQLAAQQGKQEKEAK